MVAWYKIVVPYMTVIAFAALAQYSYMAMSEEGYDQALVDSKHRLIDQVVAESDKRALNKLKHPPKVSVEQAYYEIWNLTKDDVEKPIMLFGADGGKI
jgi:hypothetical protein